jgi:pimeloyl-ACP methyl ester carboxylesterase
MNTAQSTTPGLLAGLPAPLLLSTALGAVECVVSGEGPAVLALHGGMGGYDQGYLLWLSAAALPGYRVIALSRPGYLGTPIDSGRTPAEQADLCAAALDCLGIRRAAVMAVSGGGPCAVHFAIRHPDRCWGLVMVSAASGRMESNLPLRFHVMRLMARFPSLVGILLRQASKDPDRAAARSIPDPELRARTLRDPEAGPLMKALGTSVIYRLGERMPGLLNDVEQLRRAPDWELERIAAPTLLIHGAADEVVPFRLSADAAARIPGAELLAIPGGLHVSLFTHMAEIRSRVTAFLQFHKTER